MNLSATGCRYSLQLASQSQAGGQVATMSIQPYVGPGVGGSETALIAFGGQELSQAELEKRQKDVSKLAWSAGCTACAASLVVSLAARVGRFAGGGAGGEAQVHHREGANQDLSGHGEQCRGRKRGIPHV